MLACFSPVETWSKNISTSPGATNDQDYQHSVSVPFVTSVPLFPVLGCVYCWEAFARVWATFGQQSSGIQTSNFTKALMKDNLLTTLFWSMMIDDNFINFWPSKFSTAASIDDWIHTVNKHKINHIGNCQKRHRCTLQVCFRRFCWLDEIWLLQSVCLGCGHG